MRWMIDTKAARVAPALLALALSACVAPVGPVEVTRFVAPQATALGRGLIRVEAAPGQPDDLEFRAYAAAVSRELAKLGYTEPLPAATAAAKVPQVALVTLERVRFRPERTRGPVSVGVGGGTGGYGSGVGVGVGIDLSGPPPEQVATRLSVTIRERPSGASLWEGRAAFTVRADSPLAGTGLGSAKMAEALFGGFPGRSGETILVK